MARAKILTIDDDPSFNKLLKVYLTKLKFDCEITSDPKDFLYQLRVYRPDLCLIDLNLDVKQGAGFQLIEVVRSHMPELPLIVLSRRSSKEDTAHAFELGATDFLNKPIDDFTLDEKLKAHLQQKPLKGDINDLFLISKPLRQCEFSVDVHLSAISEDEFTFKSFHFFAKGTYVKFKSEQFKDIYGDLEFKGTVYKNWIDPETKECSFTIPIEFEDEQKVKDIRHWILEQAKGQGSSRE